MQQKVLFRLQMLYVGSILTICTDSLVLSKGAFVAR